MYGTAYQLLARDKGHRWIDYSAVQEQQQNLDPFTTFTSNLSFDINTYRMRSYDGVEDAPASALHVSLFGKILDYSSYQSWGRVSCTVVKKKTAPADAMAYGMMADLMRARDLRMGQKGLYSVVDPYGSALIARATYSVIGRETLTTVLGKLPTFRVRFREGAQPPLDVWYSVSPAHLVVQWGTSGVFSAKLTHYEPHSKRTALPVAPVKLSLKGKLAACA